MEDDQALRDGLRDILEHAGFAVITAADGREGLAQLQRNRADLILSDISMPHMDGYSFCREVRNHAQWVTIPFIFLSALGEKRDILAGKELGVEDYLVKPFGYDELLTAVRSRLARSRQLFTVQLQQSYEASLTALANAIEVRDHYTRGHVERVTSYALALAHRLGWSGVRMEVLRFGGILHDIGKIHVRESVLTKSGPLTAEEWADIRQHPITGEAMIQGIPYLAPATPVIRHHHERWDGSGYPDGLAGARIPLEARIVAVADSLDAMTSNRAYRPGMPFQQAYEALVSRAGTYYDPAVIAALTELWAENQLQAIALALENPHAAP